MANREREKQEALKVAWQKAGLAGIDRIEAYDISHIAGTDSVGAMVVFEEGKPSRKSYRRFRIKTAPGGGDTDSLREVVFRRINRGLEQSPGFLPMPDLLLIDGGTNQVKCSGAGIGRMRSVYRAGRSRIKSIKQGCIRGGRKRPSRIIESFLYIQRYKRIHRLPSSITGYVRKRKNRPG